MTNIAYTAEYQKRRKSFESVRVPENLRATERDELEGGLYAEHRLYRATTGELRIEEARYREKLNVTPLNAG
ncbi:MAG: hypothetical protein LBL86_11335 [Coriobacteriales bacterium]|jgi:hypothetical protein|nr:hypothetical protein [Coriobacteriales bacterium]